MTDLWQVIRVCRTEKFLKYILNLLIEMNIYNKK